MASDGPLGSPLARAINLRVADLGGQPLRFKMLDGRMQFWVVLDGRTLASGKLRHLADALGVPPNGEHKMSERPSDLISVGQAAKITGYSTTVIHKAAKTRDLQDHGQSPRKRRLSKADVLGWAERKRRNGGTHLPRRRGPNGAAPAKRKFIHADGAGKGFALGGETHARMMRYVEKLGGLMTAQEFTERVVRRALDKLGA